MSRNILIVVALGALLAQFAAPQTVLSGEYDAKAGYLLNFAEFVEWPAGAFADAKAPFVLGVMGKDPFGGELDKLEGKTVNGHKLEIKRFKGALEFRGKETPGRRQEDLAQKQAKKLAELKSCHILFISASEKKYLSEILKPLKEAGVLTVGETESFAHDGGIINFVDGSGKVQLQINLDAAGQARLKISSKLLSLAKVITIEHEDGKR
jgi:hypothetical protein